MSLPGRGADPLSRGPRRLSYNGDRWRVDSVEAPAGRRPGSRVCVQLMEKTQDAEKRPGGWAPRAGWPSRVVSSGRWEPGRLLDTCPWRTPSREEKKEKRQVAARMGARRTEPLDCPASL